MSTKPTIVELGTDSLDEILRRVEAQELGADDWATIHTLLLSYVHLTELLKDKSTSIARLRKMLFGASTEKTAALLGSKVESVLSPAAEARSTSPQDDAVPASAAAIAESQSSAPGKGHGRNGADVYTGAEKIEVRHDSLQPGDACPKCETGTVYETGRPGVLVRLKGQAPLQAMVYFLQKLRCNLCGVVFTAAPPEGVGSAKYDATAGSMIALLKYGTGMPFNRDEKLQGSLGIPLPASTQWDIVNAQAQRAEPAFEELIRQAAQGEVVYNDDTTVKILELMDEPSRAEGSDKEAAADADTDADADTADGTAEDSASQRRGMFTSGVVSTRHGRRIALFFSGRKHAGENLKDVLIRRAAELPSPIQMCDALSRNLPGELQTIVANCLAHGRRKFVEVFNRFPEHCRRVLEALKVIYKNDAMAREQKLSAEQRLLFHQAESGPTMRELHVWLEQQFAQRLVEPNSALGAAISYLLKRWEKLTLFLRRAGAPLDNNICERALKKAICHRKNSLFYKTCHGAHVGDIFMSLIHTCELCGANPFDYLSELDRHAAELSSHLQDWMPWNYRQTLAGISAPSA
jgi:transposase